MASAGKGGVVVLVAHVRYKLGVTKGPPTLFRKSETPWVSLGHHSSSKGEQVVYIKLTACLVMLSLRLMLVLISTILVIDHPAPYSASD